MADSKAAKAGKRVAADPVAHHRTGTLLPHRQSGRPSRPMATKLREHILDVATDLFLRDGYGSTSIEAVARAARISKRTLYHRFDGKAALFSEVVHRIIERLHPPARVPLISGNSLSEILQRLAHLMLQGALTPQALALHRLIVAESTRFPELALIANEQGGRQEGIDLVAALLEQQAPSEHLSIKNYGFAAQQFLQMVTSLPQRRAMGLGTPMGEAEVESWAHDTVDLFLNGCRGGVSRQQK